MKRLTLFLLLSFVLVTATLAQPNMQKIPPFTLAAGETRYFRVALFDTMNTAEPYPLPFTSFQVKIDSTAGSVTATGLIDSVMVQYCKAFGMTAGDTLAKQPGALRYMLDYTGGQIDSSMNVAHTWVKGGWYSGQIVQNGHPYWYTTIVFTNSSAYPYRPTIKIEQAGVK
jgi:hypothetical protein